MSDAPPSPSCADCGAHFATGLLARLVGPNKLTCPSEACGKALCPKCLAFSCVPADKAVGEGATKNAITTLCKACFRTQSSLNFDVTEDVVEPLDGQPCLVTVIFVHGGGGCRSVLQELAILPEKKLILRSICISNLTTRMLLPVHLREQSVTCRKQLITMPVAAPCPSRLMFARAARALAAHGARCVLLDLPGHGARMDEPLSLDTAVDTIVATTRAHAGSGDGGGGGGGGGGTKPIYIGGSLGGYIGMEVLGRHPDLSGAAVILMSGQKVGVGRGWAASAGLAVMRAFLPLMGSATVLRGLVSQARKNGHISDECLLEISLRPGMFFRQGVQQVDILAASDPLASLPKFPGPILFINGSRDHHDAQDAWRAAARAASLIVYEGADHFFTHDSRFEQRFIDDAWAFALRYIGGAAPGTDAGAAGDGGGGASVSAVGGGGSGGDGGGSQP
eukprot:TRINITY_DN264_c0_g1_i2.p1 TRINITY_DN264_c0_g1~~TRINITY_DN264_c0_g1_i2.p1  ORF type:complete len:450 (-),score=74.99 TRINITY_DN264_c0_g1_i2:569-1918(-)